MMSIVRFPSFAPFLTDLRAFEWNFGLSLSLWEQGSLLVGQGGRIKAFKRGYFKGKERLKDFPFSLRKEYLKNENQGTKVILPYK